MEYGSIIGEAHQDTMVRSRIEIDNVLELFVKYFNNPTFKKIKDDEHFSVYMTCIKCMIIGTCRYIIVNISIDGLPIGTERKLESMDWVMIQTRTLEGKFNTTNHAYTPKTSKIYESRLSVMKRTKKYSEYSCENIPIKVTIFHKKKLEYEYPNNGSLNSAIEIYNTAISRT